MSRIVLQWALDIAADALLATGVDDVVAAWREVGEWRAQTPGDWMSPQAAAQYALWAAEWASRGEFEATVRCAAEASTGSEVFDLCEGRPENPVKAGYLAELLRRLS